MNTICFNGVSLFILQGVLTLSYCSQNGQLTASKTTGKTIFYSFQTVTVLKNIFIKYMYPTKYFKYNLQAHIHNDIEFLIFQYGKISCRFWTVPCTVKDSSIRLQYLRHISTATFMSTKMKRQKKVQFVMYLFIEDLVFYSLYRSEEPLLNLCVQLVIDMIYNHGFDLKLIHFQFSQICIDDMHCNVCV